MTYPTNRVRRQIAEYYRGRPMMVEVSGGLVTAWPKGTDQRQAISVVGAWQAAQARRPLRKVKP